MNQKIPLNHKIMACRNKEINKIFMLDPFHEWLTCEMLIKLVITGIPLPEFNLAIDCKDLRINQIAKIAKKYPNAKFENIKIKSEENLKTLRAMRDDVIKASKSQSMEVAGGKDKENNCPIISINSIKIPIDRIAGIAEEF